MEKYIVYLSGTEQQVEINPEATLSELRGKLDGAENHNFVYYNDFTYKKTLLTDRSLEQKKTVSDTAFDDSILMALVSGDTTDLIGTKTDWLYDRHAGLQVTLNNQDAEAIKQNEGKFQPIMVTDIKPTNTSVSAFYDRAVICEKGSVINFKISSWGSAGFGYSIKSNKQSIVEKIYNAYADNKDKQSISSIRRYQNYKNTIQIDSTDTLNIPTNDVVHYQKITLKTWRMTSYKQNGKTYTSNTQPPTISASKNAAQSELQFSISTGFDPGDADGDTVIPGEDIENAAPGQGAPSNQSFGSISNVKQDDRDNTVLGAVVFYFFVFKDKEAANRVINIINAPDPTAIG